MHAKTLQGTVLIVSAFLNAPPTPEPVVVLAAQTAYTPLKVGCVYILCASETTVCSPCCITLLRLITQSKILAQRQRPASSLLPFPD